MRQREKKWERDRLVRCAIKKRERRRWVGRYKSKRGKRGRKRGEGRKRGRRGEDDNEKGL